MWLQVDRRYRAEEKVFVAEGTRWLSEIVQVGVSPEMVLYTQGWFETADNALMIEQIQTPSQLISEEIMGAISDTQSPAGILAVIPWQIFPLPQTPSLLLILDQVTNPGNLGSILRSASAAGVDGVLLGPGCVDSYNPKVIRGGMGAHLRLPIHAVDWITIKEIVVNMMVWLATADGEIDYTAVDWRGPSALIIGNEARGAGKKAERLANGRISIPMHAATESLNAAMAASIILFEASRQRKNSLGK